VDQEGKAIKWTRLSCDCSPPTPSPPASCPGVQSGQFHADAGDAEDRVTVVADQPQGEADQDRREGRQPRPLCDLPDGRGRGTATDVRRDPVADRPPARAVSTGMRASGQMQQTTPEVRPNASRSAGFSASAQSTHGFLTGYRIRGTRFAVAQDARRNDPRVRTTRHPGNVGFIQMEDARSRFPRLDVGADRSPR
jgi:hypothetical protein